MITITLACVGKLKEDYLKGAGKEFTKRLGAYCHLDIRSIQEEPMPEDPSPALEAQILDKENPTAVKAHPRAQHRDPAGP